MTKPDKKPDWWYSAYLDDSLTVGELIRWMNHEVVKAGRDENLDMVRSVAAVTSNVESAWQFYKLENQSTRKPFPEIEKSEDLGPNDSCKWEQASLNVWDTQCGDCHEFIAFGPIENMLDLCPYCKKKIIVQQPETK